MIDTGDLANMLDMIGDLSKRRRRPWMLRFPFLERRLCALGLADIQPRKGRTVVASSLGRVVRFPAIASRGNIGRRKINHHYPAIRNHGTPHVVANVARMIVALARRAMRTHHPALATC